MFFTRWSNSGWLLILLCLGVAAPAAAQYRFDHWTADNGLPQNSVREIVQTQEGYLWFTTFDGLVRFDGVRFTVFNKSNSPGLATNRFVSLFEDRNGDLWAGLETGEVVRRHQGRFTTYTQAQGLPNDVFPRLADDGQGNVAVYYLRFTTDDLGNDSRASFPDSMNYTRLLLRAYRLSGDRFQSAEDVSYTFSMPPVSLDESNKLTLGKLVDGDYWVFTSRRVIHLQKGGGILIYSEGNGLPGTQPALVWGKANSLQAVSRDADGRLWLTDLKSGQNQLLSPHSPEGFEAFGGYADHEGNYWFSTNNSGLFRARRQTVTPYGKALGLNFGEIYPLLEGNDGSLWIGAYGEGVFKFKDGAFTQYAPKNEGADAFGGFVSSLFEDRAGKLWVNGIWRLAEGRYFHEPWTNPLQNIGYVWTMYEDREGAYWLGADYGVVRYLNGALTRYSTNDGLAGNDTKVIIEDGKGGLWLGSYGGLTHYKEGKFTAWTEKDGLPGATVRALKQDGDGTLWIGTYDSGLGRFKDGRFTRYTTRDGLFDNGVFQILEDDSGWLWMSCNRGIYRVRKQELNEFADGKLQTINCLAYNKNDGMPSTECNGGRWPAGVKTRDGKLWFPTMGGVAMIDPASIKANTTPPPVVIEGMQINNEPAPFEAWDSAIHNPQSAIRIRPGQDNFEIQYAALSFINSENLRFKYKLEGADQDWVDAGTRRTAYFSHVSPGNYTFRVIAANADGVWNLTGASLRITIVPPFWRTWWFVTLIVLGVAGVIVGLWKFRVGQLQRVQVAQAAFARRLIASQEAERKRIAGELHDSLGQSLVIIRNWAMLGAGQLENDAPAKEELDKINDITSRAINEVREIAYNLGPYHLERLGFENSIRDMASRVAQASGIAIATELDKLDGALSSETQMSLYRVAQEALNNVVKHSRATETRIALKRESAGVRLTVADNGQGFDPHTSKASEALGASGFGLGLNGMAERVRLLGGALTIRSAPEQGTTVEAVLPDTPENAKGTAKVG
ncbi:MAG TPA: two-component regulator propeller domain-containing protein [Pyrinomonadaceae bacterium]|nr:two-component regulator propeller domain-containing protein [Pyrinomonadaceae bacterium]